MDGEVQGRRRRRTHSPAFKAHVLQACSQPGVSIAAVALSNGLSANLVRRWLNGRDVSGAAAVQATQLSASLSPTGGDGFVPVHLADRLTEAADIRLELRRGPVAMSVNWPSQEAAGPRRPGLRRLPRSPRLRLLLVPARPASSCWYMMDSVSGAPCAASISGASFGRDILIIRHRLHHRH